MTECRVDRSRSTPARLLQRARAMRIEQLAERACTVGFVEVRCPRCHEGESSCSNCDGSRRLWADGPATLSDSGLERLLAIQARMIIVGKRNPFRKRQLSAIHWPTPPARNRFSVSA
jgi:hypothetical protein